MVSMMEVVKLSMIVMMMAIIMATIMTIYNNDDNRVLGEAGISKLKAGQAGQVLQAG